MLKIVELHTPEGAETFPVEADANWSQEARKLVGSPQLFIMCSHVRDVKPEDDLEDMIMAQWCHYSDYANREREHVSDNEYDAALKLYDKTWEALFND